MADNKNKDLNKDQDKGKMGQGQDQPEIGKKNVQRDTDDQRTGRKPGEMDAPSIPPNVKKDLE